ncbi:unnamed protein product [Adineta ricciae]|uniref:Mitogen-activated protein kinase kinase kinase n=1 Tax=Adineta ricciae TaxID=249248 RepID=A0A814UQT1_ADIRI|nr:unnamed protein product [Adineta ricciae]CAF1178067.1 unnamed protein product [Adineta ricciae]
MSPVPNVTNETMILSEASTTTVFNGISSLDEVDIGSLTIDDNNASDDEEPSLVAEQSVSPLISSSIPVTTSDDRRIPPAQVEVRSPVPRSTDNSHSDDNSGLIRTFFGCFKPIFYAMNKFGENIKSTKNMTINSLVKTSDDWEIPIDSIMNDLHFIGTGMEGSVFHGKLNGQDVACKRVKNKEETNIKHLKKLDHNNVVKFRGISVAPPLFYIVMEYCAYGSLYDVLKRRRDIRSYTKPTQVLDWSRQISNGVDYLHSNKIVHRDLKSPNILFSDQHTLKISDFGISKELGNRRSQIMSFSGTSAWMAPEVIRKELCSEKIDVWSFGIVLWEILTCNVPYDNIDPSAIVWGVGKGSLTLPIPASVPEGFKLLMNMCWDQQPSGRPSFPEITKHLDARKSEIILFEQEQEYAELTRIWSIEINEQLSKFPTIDISSTLRMNHDELLKKRQEELQHIADIRTHYQKRVQQVDTLYDELKSFMMQLEQRERVIKEKERLLKINSKKTTVNSISEARKKSLELIKIATSNLNDPMHLLLNKKRNTKKLTSELSHSQSTAMSRQPSLTTTNRNSSHSKSPSRRRKLSNSRRTNTKIDNPDPRRPSVTITNGANTVVYIADQTAETIPVTTSLPTISAEIESKSKGHTRELNPRNLTLDLQDSKTASLSSLNRQRYMPDFSTPPRKSSSSGPEDFDEYHHRTLSRQRPRRRMNSANKTRSSSVKSTDHLPSEANETSQPVTHATLQLSPTTQRKLTKHLTYTSSEEGEVEEIHSDNFILDDEKHRAKHQQANGHFSSEGENYGDKPNESFSRDEGLFSDEGGHVSDNRPESRESMLNSEYIEEE